jgi:ATP-binding cassette subfamily C protein LapB
VARHYDVPFSLQGAQRLALSLEGAPVDEQIGRLARKLGLRIKPSDPATMSLTSWRLPIVVQLRYTSVGVVMALGSKGEATVFFSGDGGLPVTIPADTLLEQTRRLIVPRPERAMADERVDAYIAPHRKHWFRRLAFSDIRPYGHVMLASLVANILALAGVLFSMQVYDRVIPANSYNTLYVLFLGVMLALAFDFVMRRLRTRIIDIVGKRADVRMSDLVFGHALRVRNRERPTSTGTFIAQLRDLEQVRELLTSTTVAAIADLPFFFLFLFIFWVIAGPLAAVPLAALFVLLLPGLLLQGRLRACANEAMRESSLRNAMLVEAVQGGRVRKLAIERVNGEPVVGSPYASVLLTAGKLADGLQKVERACRRSLLRRAPGPAVGRPAEALLAPRFPTWEDCGKNWTELGVQDAADRPAKWPKTAGQRATLGP